MKLLSICLSLMLLFSSVAVAGMTPTSGRQIVTTAGTEVQLVTASTLYSSVTICAETDNTGVITVGGNPVVATQATRTGVPLNAGDCYTREVARFRNGFATDNGDLSEIYIDSTVNGDGVTYEYFIQ